MPPYTLGHRFRSDYEDDMCQLVGVSSLRSRCDRKRQVVAVLVVCVVRARRAVAAGQGRVMCRLPVVLSVRHHASVAMHQVV